MEKKRPKIAIIYREKDFGAVYGILQATDQFLGDTKVSILLFSRKNSGDQQEYERIISDLYDSIDLDHIDGLLVLEDKEQELTYWSELLNGFWGTLLLYKSEEIMEENGRNHLIGFLEKAVYASEDEAREERERVRELIDTNGFNYHFQPIVNAKNGQIYAYEALMRSGKGIRISPVTILEHAQALGKLYDIEKCTLTNTLSYIDEHKELFVDRKLFINSIPACVLSDADYANIFEKYRMIMPRIVVEFTEQTEASQHQLRILLERSKVGGYQVAIDDYGTGYSNISNLLEFMPNCVKIDRMLITNIHQDRRKQYFVKNIVEYAHENHFLALGEGVETKEELQKLIALDVDLLQGFYIGKPKESPVEEIDKEIVDEIALMNRLAEEKRTHKYWYAEDGQHEVSMMELGLGGYTDVMIDKEDFTIVGDPNNELQINIHIKESLDCLLHLKNVALRNEHMEACVALGEDCRLRLDICGRVSISGSIYVPSSAALDIIGEGELYVASASNHTYAIGAPLQSGYGDIGIHLKNKMIVQLDSDNSVAIGGGLNPMARKIEISTKALSIAQTGKLSLGIGCVTDPAYIAIKDTDMNFDIRSADSFGIGSVEASADIQIEHCKMKAEMSGNIAACIVNGDEGNSIVKWIESDIYMRLRGKIVWVAGSLNGPMDLTMRRNRYDILCEGTEATVFGSRNATGFVQMTDCTGEIHINSADARMFCVKGRQCILKGNRTQFYQNRELIDNPVQAGEVDY